MSGEYNEQNSLGGRAMLQHRDCFCNAAFTQSAVPAYDWQNNGLTLRYPYSSR